MPPLVAVLNGPNLNMLGLRQPAIYGSVTLDDVEQVCAQAGERHGMAIDFRQTNGEGGNGRIAPRPGAGERRADRQCARLSRTRRHHEVLLDMTLTAMAATTAGYETDLPDVLDRICVLTRAEIERRRQETPLKVLEARLRDRSPEDRPRGFAAALLAATAERRPGLIAELKRASPSAGLIRPDFDPAGIARLYERAGASCLSVLTEGPSFLGSLDDLRRARAATSLPVLRKDFILDPWQVYESRVAGADCILLIMAALSDAEAHEMLQIARAIDLDVLVEVHDAPELQRALALDTPLIGINNRNLRTLKTDIETTVALAPTLPPDRIAVAESGIASHAEIERLSAAGASCFLVGESLLRQPDIEAATRALLGA